MDEALALARVGGDRRLLSELLNLFLLEYPQLLANVENSMAAGECTAAADFAHQMKGLLAQFAAEPARLEAAAVEQALRRSELVNARSAFERLRELMFALDPVLRSVSG